MATHTNPGSQNVAANVSSQVGLSEAQLSYLSDVLGVPSLMIPDVVPPYLAAQMASLSAAAASVSQASTGASPATSQSVSSASSNPVSHMRSERSSSAFSEQASSNSMTGERSVRVRGDLASSRLICLFHEPSDWPLVGERAKMASKMIFAMKLDAADVLEVEWRGMNVQDELRSMPLSAGSRPVLLFGVKAAQDLLKTSVTIGEFVDFDGVHVMPTYSLVELAAQPNLKKATWLHMQKVMKTLI